MPKWKCEGSTSTYSLGVDRVHGEEECRDEGQPRVLEYAALARVHEQAGHGAVQAHVDDVETERRHPVQQDVQPVRQTEREMFSTAGRSWDRIGALSDAFVNERYYKSFRILSTWRQ